MYYTNTKAEITVTETGTGYNIFLKHMEIYRSIEVHLLELYDTSKQRHASQQSRRQVRKRKLRSVEYINLTPVEVTYVLELSGVYDVHIRRAIVSGPDSCLDINLTFKPS